MQATRILADRGVALDPAQLASPAADAPGFVWLDLTQEELQADPEGFRGTVERLTGVRLFDLHLQDALNATHPSFFDSTDDYDLLVFRKLEPGASPPEEVCRERLHALQEIVARPVTFFAFERLLVTVRNSPSKTIEQMRARLLADRSARQAIAPERGPDKQRMASRPDELMLRLINGMVDRYFELRQPLTDRLERWQRELLDPRWPFSDWRALLDGRLELRQLENLCEEQFDALQDLRDSYLDTTPQSQQSDTFLVRVADVIEHIRRVLTHAQRMEHAIETAVQLHFSATAHRTNEIVRLLTVITAVFAPLTLLAGIWGMNFERIPLAHHPQGFWLAALGMAVLGLLLWFFFWANHFLSDRPASLRRWWRGLQRGGAEPPPGER